MSVSARNAVRKKRRFILLSLMFLFIVTGIGFLGFSYAKSTIVTLDSSILRYLESVALKVDSILLRQENFIEHLAGYMGLSTDEEVRNSRSLFNSFLDNDPELLNIFYVSVEGPEQGGYMVHALAQAIPEDAVDWTQRSWFLRCLESDKPILTEPYVDAISERACVTIAHKVLRNDRVVGAVGIDVKLKIVDEILSLAPNSEDTFIDLVDMNLNYITNKDKLKVGKNFSFFKDYERFLEKENKGEGDSLYVHFLEKRLNGNHGDGNIAEIGKNDNEHSKHSYAHLSDKYSQHFLTHRLMDNTYFAGIHLESADWVLVSGGYLSDFTNPYIVFAFIFLFFPGVAVIFFILIIRSWKNSARLEALSIEMSDLNETLTQRVKDRTSDIQAILDSAGQGFLTFSKDLLVHEHYSKGCYDIFGKDIANLKVTDLLFSGRPSVAEDMEQGLTLFFRKTTKSSVVFDLLEHETVIADKVLSIDYKETASGDCLCILTDTTLEEELKKKNQAEIIRNKRILRALQQKHFFIEFVESAENLFATLALYHDGASMEKGEVESLLFLIHTFKGNAGFFLFNETQTEAHEAETLIKDSLLLSSNFSCDEVAIKIRREFYREMKVITDVMGESWLDDVSSVSLPTEAYFKIIQYVKKKIPKAKQLLLYLEHYRLVSLQSLFAKLPFFAEAAAEKLGKKIEPMVIVGGELRVVPDRYYPLVNSCVHIINNIVDHGIEFSYEREAIQKKPKGKVELNISNDKSNIILEFKDDGRGLNAQLIEKKAEELGIDKSCLAPGQSVLNLIFEDGFSTNENVNKMSGRGLGLAAVKKEVLNLGGTINVYSRIGRGTTFEILLPLK